MTFKEIAGSTDLCLSDRPVKNNTDVEPKADLDLAQFEADTGRRIVELAGSSMRVKTITSLNAPSVVKVGQYCFYENSTITNVSLSPNFNQATGEYHFNACKKLVRFSPMTISGMEIVPKAFMKGCESLEGELSFPDATAVMTDALSSCKKITKLSLPKVKSVINCQAMVSLTRLEINPDIEEFGNQAFRGATQLTSISTTVFPKLTNVAYYAFFSVPNCGDWVCDNLRTVGGFAFSANSGITSFTAPNLVRIESDGFNKCTAMESMVISDDAFFISTNAFNSCSKLTSFSPYLPTNLVFLGWQAFRDTKIPQVPSFISQNLTEIGGQCFRGPDKLFTEAVDFYSPIVSFGDCAFFEAKNGQVFNFYGKDAPLYIGKGAFGTGRCCRLNVKRRSALPGWAAHCLGNEARFETYKSRADYPGDRTIGLVYTGTGGGITESWHYVVDDTPPGGVVLMVL